MESCCEDIRIEGADKGRCPDECPPRVHPATPGGVQPEDVQVKTVATPSLIVGLGHRKRVGKDTFANMLDCELQRRGYRVYKIAFARAMKAMTHSMFQWAGLMDEYYYEVNPEEREEVLPILGLTPRQIWIRFGNAMRSIDENIWIAHLRLMMDDCRNLTVRDATKPIAFIITDVRFPNEAEAVKHWGGKLVKIMRDFAPRSDDPAECALDGYPGWDRYVTNNTSIDDLLSKARRVVEYLNPKNS